MSSQMTPQTLEALFWSRVDKSGDCWIWTGPRLVNGYGRFCVEGRTIVAHRFAYACLVGPPPAGLGLGHRCPNRTCVNPAHLLVGARQRSGPVPRPLAERFWQRVDRSGPCWEWTGDRVPSGYGQLKISGGRFVSAHRLAYELLVGPIPAGLEIDHLCRNRGCVNPAHLEPVTRFENIRRGVPFRKPPRKRGPRKPKA